MCTHLPVFEIVRVLVVVLLDLWQLPCLPIMLMPVVDQVANSNQATFVANQNVWQSSSEDQCVESVLVRLISQASTIMVKGSIQHVVDGRSMACSPRVLVCRIFYGRLSRAPRLGLSATFGLPSNRRQSSRQCMASGIKKIIPPCSYVDLGINKCAWKTNRENPSLGTNSKLGTPKQLFSLALGPLWRSCWWNLQKQIIWSLT